MAPDIPRIFVRGSYLNDRQFPCPLAASEWSHLPFSDAQVLLLVGVAAAPPPP